MAVLAPLARTRRIRAGHLVRPVDAERIEAIGKQVAQHRLAKKIARRTAASVVACIGGLAAQLLPFLDCAVAATEPHQGDEVELPSRDGRGARRKATGRDQRRGRPAGRGTTRLFVGTGRSSGVRPQDLVGVIARKSNLSGKEIGAIEIADRFSLVEVPETAADDVVAALRQVTIKGRKATVRRERYSAAR